MLLPAIRHYLAHLLLYWSTWVYYGQVYALDRPEYDTDTTVIYAVNHPNGVFDLSLLAMAAPMNKPPCILAKKSLFRVPFVGWFLHFTDAIPVMRQIDTQNSKAT